MKPTLMPDQICVPIETPDGIFIAHYSTNGLAGLDFPSSEGAGGAARFSIPESILPWHQRAAQAVMAILAGKEPGELPPLDVSFGTAFQRRVWQALREIPFGKTRSYSEIAAAIGSPEAMRAVGAACGANRIPVLIPCHRVLAAGNRIGGFSGGLDWKRKLLEREGVLQKPLL
jgi:O-6-methylguanine DNA methyltransferase